MFDRQRLTEKIELLVLAWQKYFSGSSLISFCGTESGNIIGISSWHIRSHFPRNFPAKFHLPVSLPSTLFSSDHQTIEMNQGNNCKVLFPLPSSCPYNQTEKRRTMGKQILLPVHHVARPNIALYLLLKISAYKAYTQHSEIP